MSSTVIALFDASVPSSVNPYGCDGPYSAAAITAFAMAFGLSRCCIELREPARTLPFDLLGREVRVTHDVGQQRQHLRERSRQRA